MAATQKDDDDDDDIDINPFTMLLLSDSATGNDQNDDVTIPLPSPESGQHLENREYYFQSIESTVVIQQLPSQGLSFQLWPAAATFVTLIDNHRRHPTTSPLSGLLNDIQPHRRLRILELGSGTGLVGIAAAAILGANVTVTDLPHVIPNLRFNAKANSGVLAVNGGSVDVAPLGWGENEHMEAIGREYDLILGSDVVYHDHLYDPLIETLKFFLLGIEKKIVFVMAHLKRWKKEYVFFKKAKKHFDVEVLYTDSPASGSRVGVIVYRFESKVGHAN